MEELFIKKGTKHYKNLNEIKEKIYSIWGDKFTILEDSSKFVYKNVHQHILVKCNDCGNSYEKRINDLLHGYGCKYCTGKNFYSNESLKEFITDSTKNEYTLLSDDVYKTRDIGIFRHNTCTNKNNIFKMKIHNFITLKHRCPYCNRTSKGITMSAGVIKISEYFANQNIKYYMNKHLIISLENTRIIYFMIFMCQK